MSVKLPATISSPQDLTALVLELKEYGRWAAHEAIKKRVNAKHTSEAPQLSKAAEELLRQVGKKELNRQHIDELITTLEHYRATAPTLTVTLAAPPTGGIKTTLVTWCRDNIAPNVLVNFQFSSAILGGMVVRSGSHIFDWSFRRQLLESRGKFPEVLRNV